MGSTYSQQKKKDYDIECCRTIINSINKTFDSFGNKKFNKIVLTNISKFPMDSNGNIELSPCVPILTFKDNEKYVCIIYLDIWTKSLLFKKIIKTIVESELFVDDRLIFVDISDFKWGNSCAKKIKQILVKGIDYSEIEYLY
jgi:hypothetical protein